MITATNRRIFGQFQSRREADRMLRSLAEELRATVYVDGYRYTSAGVTVRLYAERSTTRRGWWAVVREEVV